MDVRVVFEGYSKPRAMVAALRSAAAARRGAPPKRAESVLSVADDAASSAEPYLDPYQSLGAWR